MTNFRQKIFGKIAESMGFSKVEDAIKDFKNLLNIWQFDKPISKNATVEEINFLADSVNIQRLKNNPVVLDRDTIKNIYVQILKRDFYAD